MGSPHSVPIVALQDGASQRAYWVALLTKIAAPVLEAGAVGRLHACAPFPGRADAPPRQYTLLEAAARVLTGLAPWLVADEISGEETLLQRRFAELALAMLDHGTRPGAADAWNFSIGDQPLVDAAFLGHALLRAPTLMVDALAPTVRDRIADGLTATRAIPPYENNWVLFSAMIECALHRLGRLPNAGAIDHALTLCEKWYYGDGVYGDGPSVHADYYNSFVIHPMLVDVCRYAGPWHAAAQDAISRVNTRATRYAEILERCVSPEGTFPAIGRSLAYRFGAMHGLAHAALSGLLPTGLSAGQARCAITAVVERFASFESMFDNHGWMRVGFCGAQSTMAEHYICGSSAYLCVNALIPLGLSPKNAFWADASQSWTTRALWSGSAVPLDHAMHR